MTVLRVRPVIYEKSIPARLNVPTCLEEMFYRKGRVQQYVPPSREQVSFGDTSFSAALPINGSFLGNFLPDLVSNHLLS